MYMAPGHRAYLRMAVDDRPEFVGVREADVIQPAAVHRDRMVMQAHQRMALARHAQFLVELGEHLDRDAAAGLVGYDAVEQHDAPRADVGRAVEFERTPRERGAHLRHEVVIAGDAQYGFAEAAEDPPEMLVAASVILHQVAGDQDGIGNRHVARRISQRALERFERVDAAQRARGVAEQMRVGELDDSDRTHSIELYKYAANRRVMCVTTPFMTRPRSEPGRKLPAKKCEAASAYCDLRNNGK